jgi:hypothetical protein
MNSFCLVIIYSTPLLYSLQVGHWHGPPVARLMNSGYTFATALPLHLYVMAPQSPPCYLSSINPESRRTNLSRFAYILIVRFAPNSVAILTLIILMPFAVVPYNPTDYGDCLRLCVLELVGPPRRGWVGVTQRCVSPLCSVPGTGSGLKPE